MGRERRRSRGRSWSRPAEIGLYGWEFMAEIDVQRPDRPLDAVIAIEEFFWGDAGIGMALMGSGLAAAGIAASGHALSN